MRTREGYIMLWRMIQESAIWQNNKPEVLKVALYLMMNARFTDGEWVTDSGDIIPLQKGQLVIGRKQAACDCRVSEQTFRTVLKFLQKTEFLTIKPTNKFSIITICKYGTYQDAKAYTNQHTNQELTSNQPATNQQLTTKNNYNNEDNGKNDNNNHLTGGDNPTLKGKDSKTDTKPRARNLVLEAIANLDGDIAELNQAGWKRAAQALRDIKEVLPDVTVEEIKRRAANYRTHFEGAALTSTALSKHWARCKDKNLNNAKPDPDAWRKQKAEPIKEVKLSRDMALSYAVDSLAAADKQGGDVGRCMKALNDKYRDMGKDRDGMTVASEAYEIWKGRNRREIG